MKLIGQEVLGKFKKKHADARGWIDTWAKAVEQATWQSIDDVRKTVVSLTVEGEEGYKLEGRSSMSLISRA